LEPDDFRFDTTYPDLTTPRTDEFVLIEILLSVGRSVKVKKKILADILGAVSRKPDVNPEGVMGLLHRDLVGELVVRRRPIRQHVTAGLRVDPTEPA
jgi:hypothetical protein